MLRFTAYQMWLCYLETYTYLINRLQLISGYPVKLLKTNKPLKVYFDKGENGELLYKLYTTNEAKIFPILSIHSDAGSDELSKKIFPVFVKHSKNLISECKRPVHIKQALIKETNVFWDSLVLSLNNLSTGDKLYALDALSTLRDSLLFRYEGEQLECGVILTWNWSVLKEKLSKLNSNILTFKSSNDFHDVFSKAKHMHALADGFNSFYVLSKKGRVKAWVTIPKRDNFEKSDDWDLVPLRYQNVKPFLQGKDLVFSTTKSNEIFYFNNSHAFKWSKHEWHRVSIPSITEILAEFLPKDNATILSQVIRQMSQLGHGGLFVISDKLRELTNDLSLGIKSQFRGYYLMELLKDNVESIIKLASIDGSTLVSTNGRILNAGVILNVPDEHTSAGEGARTAAASSASRYGLAIKISHDGPITFYKDGNLIRNIA